MKFLKIVILVYPTPESRISGFFSFFESVDFRSSLCYNGARLDSFNGIRLAACPVTDFKGAIGNTANVFHRGTGEICLTLKKEGMPLCYLDYLKIIYLSVH